jgi:DNA-directed RNA polymerase subunit H
MKELDITKHVLVPKHEIISESEKEELLKRYGISLRQLPRILVSDPAIKHLNPKIGDVIRIRRKGPTGETEYYRVVVKG